MCMAAERSTFPEPCEAKQQYAYVCGLLYGFMVGNTIYNAFPRNVRDESESELGVTRVAWAFDDGVCVSSVVS